MIRLLALLGLLFVTPAFGQADVVASCGSKTIKAGTSHNVTVDLTGASCRMGGGNGGSGGGGVVSSVWSAADAAANTMTLSNGGLTMTPQPMGQWYTIRNTTTHSTGKVYIEFLSVLPGTPANTYQLFGLATAAFPLGADHYLGIAPSSFGLQPGGGSVMGTGFTQNYVYSLPSAVLGDVWAEAIDFNTGNIWIARNNVWANGSNPVTGTLPIVSFAPGTMGEFFAAMSVLNTGGSWTIKPTYASQLYQSPAGFVAWDAASTHRYWRINMTANTSAGTDYSIAEIQFRAAAGVPLLFSGGTASASTIFNPSYPASQAADNNPATLWGSDNLHTVETWTYDYGAGNGITVVEITIQTRADPTYFAQAPSVFTPQWSNDGIAWTSMAQITAAPWTTPGQIQTFAVTPGAMSKPAPAPPDLKPEPKK